MMRCSSPLSFNSVPAYLLKRLRSPALTSGGDELAIFMSARADGYHAAFLRFFLGSIGDDDTAFGFFLLLYPFYNDTIMQWANVRVHNSLHKIKRCF